MNPFLSRLRMCTIETIVDAPIRPISLIRRMNSLFAAKKFPVRPRTGKFASNALNLQKDFRLDAKSYFAGNALKLFAELAHGVARRVADLHEFPVKFPDLREM